MVREGELSKTTSSPGTPLADLLVRALCGAVPRIRILRNNVVNTSADLLLYRPTALADHGLQSLFINEQNIESDWSAASCI